MAEIAILKGVESKYTAEKKLTQALSLRHKTQAAMAWSWAKITLFFP